MGGTGSKESITITNDQNRLTPDDIERMVQEAERFADEDKKVKERVESRNELESYLYGLKNHIGDDDKLGGKLSEEDKETITEAVDEKISWLGENADADDFKAAKKEVEDIVAPIVSSLYEGAGASAGGFEEVEGEEHDEL